MTSRLFDDDTLPPDVVRAFGDIAPRRRLLYAVAVGATTAQGATRTANEDAWGHRHGRAFVVADGMGGRPGGAGAAAITVDRLLDELSVADAGVEWSDAVARVDAVLEHAGRLGHQRVGAAAAAVRFVDGRLTVVHLGDVRAYRMRGDQVELLTTDHTLGEELERAGLAPGDAVPDARGSLSARDLAGLTTFFGDPGSSDRFTVRSLSVRDGDRIALCTDGVHRHIPAATWRQAADEPTVGAVAHLLVGSAIAHGTTDDATALVLEFTVTADDDG